MYQLGLDAAEGGDLAAAVKKIEEAIDKAADPGLKALGYNVLGDVYRARSKSRDAMWSYLWVDLIYNQDRGEHLKAMTRLIEDLRRGERQGQGDAVQGEAGPVAVGGPVLYPEGVASQSRGFDAQETHPTGLDVAHQSSLVEPRRGSITSPRSA